MVASHNNTDFQQLKESQQFFAYMKQTLEWINDFVLLAHTSIMLAHYIFFEVIKQQSICLFKKIRDHKK